MPKPVPQGLSRDLVLSPSSIQTYQKCPYRWYLKYVEQRPELQPRSSHLIFGSAIHEALEALNIGGAKTLADIYQAFIDSLNEAEKTPVVWDIGREEIERSGQVMLTQYYSLYKEDFPPDRAEFEVSGKIYGVAVHGFVDLLTKGGLIVDYKVVGKALTRRDVETNIQFGIYADLLQIEEVAAVCFLKQRVVGCIQVVSGTRSVEAQEATRAVVAETAASIKKGVFPKIDPRNWECQAKRCGMWDWCPQGGAR